MSSEDPNAHEIAAKGSEIYDRRYRAEFERSHRDDFAAIEINSEAVYLARLPEDALSAARAGSPGGVFYLLRIGSTGAFKRRRISHAEDVRQ